MNKMNQNEICEKASKLISDIILGKRDQSESFDEIISIENELCELDDKYYVNKYLACICYYCSPNIFDKSVLEFKYLENFLAYYKDVSSGKHGSKMQNMFNVDFEKDYFEIVQCYTKDNEYFKIELNDSNNCVIKNFFNDDVIEDVCIQNLTVCDIFNKIAVIEFEKTGKYYSLSDKGLETFLEKLEELVKK